MWQKQKTIPACIQHKIEQKQKDQNARLTGRALNPPAEVNEYNYYGKQVYLFTSNCCDQYNILYGSDCIAVCAPSGGYTGKGDRKCDDFIDKAKLVKLVWKDQQ